MFTEPRGGASNEIYLRRLILNRIILAADAANQAIFIADAPYQIVSIKESHSVVGGAAAAVTVEKLTGTTAPGVGTAILTAAFDCTATINTTQTGTLTATTANTILAAGDRLGLVGTGTRTGLLGIVTIELKRID